MSRHRDIRNMNYRDELDDTAISDEGDEDMTLEQQGLPEDILLASVQAEYAQAQMNDGLEQVRLILGDEASSDISDLSIKEALWEYYFDVDKTVQWAYEERQRRRIARERKDRGRNSGSTSSGYEFSSEQEDLSGQGNENIQYDQGDPQLRLPSIFRAQQQPGFDSEAYLAVESPRPVKKLLSTISEHTERTEPSIMWRSRQTYYVPDTPRTYVSSSTTTSYGREIDAEFYVDEHPNDTYNDPNTGRASPSGSAIQRLSTFDPPPSNSSSSTISPNEQLYPASDPASSLPTIPDFNSKSSDHDHKPLPPQPIASPKKTQSKLSKLASSRTSSASSVSASSRSSGTAVTGSIKTFPALRPSAHSERPPSTFAPSEVSSKELPPLPPPSTTPTPSSTSSLVRRAIRTALELEDLDREPTPKPQAPHSTASEDDRSKTPTPASVKAQESRKAGSSQSRPLSKLALLAQQKSETASNRSVPLSELAPSSVPSPTRPLSKLAMLAQQKVDSSRVPKLPKTTTEYLTPIANGSSVTTAITTSYQSLYSLTDPNRSNVIPRLDLVPLQSPGGVSPSAPEPKTSKLAMKIKKANEKPPVSPGFPSEDEVIPPVSPLFQPKSPRVRALPSAFAFVLLRDRLSSEDKTKDKDTKRKKKDHDRQKDKDSKVKDRVLSEESLDSHPRRSRKHKPAKSPMDDPVSPRSFSFDSPSPDDIVLNARKGTALGQKAPASTASAKRSTGAGKTPLTT
ncbi:hypothetical protein NLJ89_g6679 [Agrocybe chaxingu]|uniref:HBS1-like protein N-terminal domain-containing protein n=1 Tax=Agrocybe chaxingu TaxID=84603 RepID=A0A9W8JW08_9AGAR|nr:hypothetical protein NLJ89_g6679 [Agrocybe chaxingu]